MSKKWWQPLLMIPMVLSSFIVTTPAMASEVVVCEGEYYVGPGAPNGCPRDGAATPCYTIDEYAINFCIQSDGTRLFKKIQLSSRGGNHCGYSVWQVICQ